MGANLSTCRGRADGDRPTATAILALAPTPTPSADGHAVADAGHTRLAANPAGDGGARPPQLTVTPYNFVNETSCRGTFSPYAITVTNSGGRILTWQLSQQLYQDYYVNLTAWSGSLGADQSQPVTL